MMIYILKISCYASMVNKRAMTFILLVLSPLVCSGYTFEFSQRASFSIPHFVRSCKNTISVFNHRYFARTRRDFPPKWEIPPIQGSKKCLLARGKAVHCEDKKVVSHFGALAPRNQEKLIKLQLFLLAFFFEILWDKSQVPVRSSKGTHFAEVKFT